MDAQLASSLALWLMAGLVSGWLVALFQSADASRRR
jgi:hypothetical protein